MAGEKILVVEDSMIVVMHLKSVLQDAGYKVIATVATGEEAVIIVDRERPDLIMMDIILAGQMDGITASEIIQQRWKIPVIFLTALNDKTTIQRAKNTGPFNFVTKPFDEGDIITRVEFSLYKNSIEKERERQRLSHLIQGQELERGRISRELHDGLGQLLNAIQYNLASITESNVVEVKATVTRLISDALIESKRISSNLLPLKLNDFDLITCLHSLTQQVNSEKIQVVFQTEGPINIDSNDYKLALYRIVQEGLNNAEKHSECSKIFVQLYGDDEWINLSIEDDGKGFEKEKVLQNGHGLKNIRYRVEVLHGKFEIESNSKVGTLLSISVPVNPPYEKC